MNGHDHMDEQDFERRLAGRSGSPDGEPGPVERFLDDLDLALPEMSTEHLEADHLSAMMAAAHLLADNGEPAARPASKANGPAVQASGLPKLRRALMDRWNGLATGAKVGVGAVALVFAFTGVAVAGGLPDPVQHAVSNAAAVVGVHIPDPVPEAADNVDETETPEATETPDASGAARESDHEDATETVAPDEHRSGTGANHADENANTDENDNSDGDSGGNQAVHHSSGDQGDQNDQNADEQDSEHATDGGDSQGSNDQGDGAGATTSSGAGATTDGGHHSDGGDAGSGDD